MSDCLKEIIANKKPELEALKQKFTYKDLAEKSKSFKKRSLLAKVISNKQPFVISEFKRASPSKGAISENANLLDICLGYEKGGASAISVLTEKNRFLGSLEDLRQVRAVINTPLLRKDFLVDPLQVAESKANGADIILLIAAALSRNQAEEMLFCARELDLEVLLEVHDLFELERFGDLAVDFLGVNNRNLKTLNVNLATSVELAPMLHSYASCRNFISESGLKNASDLLLLKSIGYKGFLIGESFMKNEKPEIACANLIQELNA